MSAVIRSTSAGMATVTESTPGRPSGSCSRDAVTVIAATTRAAPRIRPMWMPRPLANAARAALRANCRLVSGSSIAASSARIAAPKRSGPRAARRSRCRAIAQPRLAMSPSCARPADSQARWDRRGVGAHLATTSPKIGHDGPSASREPIEVTWWATSWGILLPGGLHDVPLGKTDQDRVHRAGLQAEGSAQVVSVSPSRVLCQVHEHRDRLRGGPAGRHRHNSIYIDF